jgi:hypothetical protein
MSAQRPSGSDDSRAGPSRVMTGPEDNVDEAWKIIISDQPDDGQTTTSTSNDSTTYRDPVMNMDEKPIADHLALPNAADRPIMEINDKTGDDEEFLENIM